MLFKPKFFLDLGSDGEQQKPASIAPVVAKPEPQAVKQESATQAATEAAASTTGSLTTAEAIVAELAAAQANRPAPSLATFAPECVIPGGGLVQRRRRSSADLGGFKAMARDMMRS